MRDRARTVLARVQTWAPIAGIFLYGAITVATHHLDLGIQSAAHAVIAWAPWVLGPTSDVLRENAATTIRLALAQLDGTSSSDGQPDVHAYTRELANAERTLRLATRASAVDGRSVQMLAAVQFESRLVDGSTARNGCGPLLKFARHLRPNDVVSQLEVATTYLRMGDPDTALAIAGEMTRANPTVGPRAVAIFDGYDLEPGKIAASLGESPLVIRALKARFLDRGLLAEYMSALERILPAASGQVIDEYGDLGEQYRQWKRVRETLEAIGPLDSRESEASRIAVLARASFADGEFVQAETQARRAAGLDPTNAGLHELLAGCLAALGRDEDALVSLDLALMAAVSGGTSNGQRARLYRKMGEAYERQGRGDRAYEAYSRAIGLVPDDDVASERLRSITRGHERIPTGP